MNSDIKKSIFVAFCIVFGIFSLVKYLMDWSISSVPSLILDNAVSTMIPSEKESKKALKQLEHVQTYNLISRDVLVYKDKKIEEILASPYFSDCDEVNVEDEFSIDWMDLITVDSIRVQQNFKKFDKKKAIEIGIAFLKFEKSKHTVKRTRTKTRTITHADGTTSEESEEEEYEVIIGKLHVYKAGFEDESLHPFYLKDNPEKSILAATYMFTTLTQIYTGENNQIAREDLTDDAGFSFDSEFQIEGENITSLNYFNQARGEWADRIYGAAGQGKYKNAGCGPTAAAIIFSSLKKDKSINPETMGNLFYKKGLRASNGTTHNCMVVAAKEYGLKSEFFSPSAKKLAQHLKEGHVVSTVQGRNKNELYSGKGHFIVLNGIREQNGKVEVYVTDPGYRKKIGWWPIETVIDGSKNMTAVYP